MEMNWISRSRGVTQSYNILLATRQNNDNSLAYATNCVIGVERLVCGSFIYVLSDPLVQSRTIINQRQGGLPEGLKEGDKAMICS